MRKECNPNRQKMKKIYFLLFIFYGLTLTSCGEGEQENEQAAQAQEALPYPVIEVPVQNVTAYTTYPAKIEGVVNSDVRAKIAGYITDVLVDEGQQVKKGQLLFKLETQSLNQEANAARANVNAAQVEVEKLKPLVEKNIISNVQLETAKAKLQQAQSTYNSIAAQIGYANIKSPVDGVVGSIRLRKGALVSPSDQNPLTTVADISEVYAYFSMNEKEYLNFIQEAEGSNITQKIENMPKISLLLANDTFYDQEGTIETINSQVNDNTGSISFRAKFDNPSRLLTNGNSGEIQIPKEYTNVLVIPQESTYEQQGATYVYKLSQDNKVTGAQINIETQVDNLYVINSGVEKGDRIVATGVGKLRSGAQIKPQEISFDSIAKPIDKVFR